MVIVRRGSQPMPLVTTAVCGAGLLFFTTVRPAGAAEAEPPSPPSSEEAAPPTPPTRAPYTLPFQLRGMIPKPGVRLDSTFAPYQLNGTRGFETVVFWSAQLPIVDSLSVVGRWGLDDNQSDQPGYNRTGILNPTLGVLLGLPLRSDFRFAASAAAGFPIATGGGNDPRVADLTLQREGMLARSAMDNTSFAVNDVGVPAGVSFAYVGYGMTVQLDTTIIPSFRVKGERAQADRTKVNSTYGLFFGYRLVPELSVGAELRYQRYLSTPATVAKDPTARDNLTLAGGPRIHVRLTDTAWMRPGLSYGHGLRGPVERQAFHMVQLDIPFTF